MDINSRGDIAHGIGGGQASVNNVAFSRGAVLGWKDDDTVAFVDGTNDAWIVSTYHVPSQVKTVVEFPTQAGPLKLRMKPTVSAYRRSFRRSPYQVASSANSGYAGGGHLAAWLGGSGPLAGLMSSTGFRRPSAGLLGMSRDAAIVYKPEYQSGGPTHVHELDGTDWKLMDGSPGFVHAIGGKRILLTGDMILMSVNLPTPVFDNTGGLWKGLVAEAGGRIWVSYFSGARGIVLHPIDSFDGYSHLAKGDGWHHMREIAPGIIRIATATTEGEQAGQIWVRDYDVEHGMVRDPWGANTWTLLVKTDIRKINEGAIPVPPVDPPPPPPPPENKPMMMPQDVYNTYSACVAKFPHTGTDDDRREANRKAVATLRALHGPQWVCKSEHNLGWPSASKDAVGYVPSGTAIHGQKVSMYIWDMINGVSRQPNPRGEADAPREAYALVPDPEDFLGGGPVTPPPPSGDTHRYVGGGNDTGTCDDCGKPKLDPVHAVPEGKVKGHTPWLGEDGKGDCDLCFQPVSAPIHQKDVPVDPPPVDPGGSVEYHEFVGSATAKFCSECGQARTAAVHQKPQPQPTPGTTVDMTATNQKLDEILASNKRIEALIEKQTADFNKGVKSVTDVLGKLNFGGLFGKKTPTKK